jgi:hypothetical protein
MIFRSKVDKPREECGVFGIFGHPDAAVLTTLGLHALQHRGQEACGIVTFHDKRFHAERHLGLVGDNFTGDDLPNPRLHPFLAEIEASNPSLNAYVVVLEQEGSIVVVGGTNARGVTEVANEVSWQLAESNPQ